jgi:hypothetical protein
VSEHEAIEELLAGYALRSLSGPDAADAEVALSEHVPGCASCRELVWSLGETAADLALALPPVEPPETLLPRLHRSMEPRERRRLAGWTPGRLVAAAAGFVLVVGLGGAALLGGEAATLRPGTAADLREAVRLAEEGDALSASVGPATEVVVPGREEFYLVGEDVPPPPTGSAYHLWLLRGDEAVHVGAFAPDADGTVVLLVRADPTAFDRLLVTVEAAEREPEEPGEPAWSEAA